LCDYLGKTLDSFGKVVVNKILNLPWNAGCLFILPKIKKKTIVQNGWMVVDMIFFSLDSCSPANTSPQLRVLKLGFIQLDGITTLMEKWE
jgi:hypothetical protein